MLPDRFLDKISPEPNSGCWLWTGTLSSNGYGHFKFNKFNFKAHRFAYESEVADIPDGLELDHQCRIRSCVNPKHVMPVTHAENMATAVMPRASQTHCLRGHEFTANNTYHHHGRRHCKICKRESLRLWRKSLF
jgi:hypothetical protein